MYSFWGQYKLWGSKGLPTHPLGLLQYISETLEKLLPSLHIQKATKLQEARLETDSTPRAHQQLNFRSNPPAKAREQARPFKGQCAKPQIWSKEAQF